MPAPVGERVFLGLEVFAHFTERLAATVDFAFYSGLGPVAENIQKHAKAVVGDSLKLKPLAPSTIAEKAKKGYSFPEAPLYASGEMKESIEASFYPGVPLAMVGSADPKLLWHHLGGMHRLNARGHKIKRARASVTNLPARPVLDIAVVESEKENLAIMEVVTAKALGFI